MDQKIRLVIADDQDLVRSGFAMILSVEDDLEVVGQAKDGAEALTMVGELKPDVVLMDVQMPRLDGIAATAEISRKYSDTQVLILTTFDREDYLFAALKAGASGFLLKNADADELVSAIHKVAGGLALLAPEMTLPLIQHLVAEEKEASPGAQKADISAEDRFRLDSLTAREIDVLKLLAQGMTNAEIAQELFLGAATVKTHVSNLLAKTHSRDRVGAVIFAYRTGLAFQRG